MEEFDYIIVGAGSAGCVLAHRLSEDRNATVLVVEAGGTDRHPLVFMPAGFSKMFRSERDWAYSTDPEPHANNRSLYLPRGKMLGGCSSINAMLYIRGRAHDYDTWQEMGAEGWSWDAVLPYFKKSEDNERGADEWHGVGGPLRVEDLREPHELSRRFVDAVDEAGLGRNDDFNGERQEGGGLFQATQRSGRRWSCASGFLRPAMRRSNVTVVTGATTHRVVFEGKRAVGIDYYRPPDGGVTVRARREVILSAGAFGSPHLLMLSGIGHAEHLRDNGIEVVEDLPVGDHLQDHPCLSMIWRSRVGPTLEDAETNTNLAKWAMLRRGPLTSTVAEACAFAHSKEGLPAADLQYHFAPGFFQHHGFVKPEHASFTVGTVLVSPQSRGRIRLRSADPSAHPSILGNHLQESADVDAIVRSMELTREIVSCGPLRKIAGDALEPPTEHATKDEQRDWIRNEIELLYHPVGTCRMGQPGDSVVDPQLRVHGLEGLRVVDASVFPLIPGGNTNAPTIMVAEKAADLIRGN